MECHNHFQEKRRKIYIRREEAKERIEIYMGMIELTKESEAHYMEHMTHQTNSVQSNNANLKEEMSSLAEKFRDPQLLIESIKELKSKQDEYVVQLKAKLLEIGKN